MEKRCEYNAVSCYDELLSELFCTNTLVKATKTYCLEKEYTQQYYGIPLNYTTKISEERNEYISLLEIISDKLTKLSNVKVNN